MLGRLRLLRSLCQSTKRPILRICSLCHGWSPRRLWCYRCLQWQCGADRYLCTVRPWQTNSRRKEIGIAFDLPLAVTQCQVRLQCAAGVSARIECLVIEFRDLATPAIEAAVGDGLGDQAVAAPFVRGSLIRQVKRLLHHPLA